MHFAIAHKFGTAAVAKQHVEAALADAKSKLAGQGSIDTEEWSGNLR
jgi:hypothetical protein